MKYLILGAGPAGLTFANMLQRAGETSFLVLEKENEAGGLCRSVDVDGAPLDIGGGHFLDADADEKVLKFLFGFMPEDEWDKYTKDARIKLDKNTVSYPIEANIWQMDIDSQVEYLKSIAQAGCNIGEKMPEKFTDWIYWKLGDKIAESYLLPYNRKIFSSQLDTLGTYWMVKLPNVNFEETLRSCLCKQAFGQHACHHHFYFPKEAGYGELWLRMAEALGGNIQYDKAVSEIDFETQTVKTTDGETFTADNIITTVPWHEWKALNGMPEELKNKVGLLKHSAVEIAYYPENLDTEAHWIYYPDLDLSYHRILVRHNFVPDSRGYWTETNMERVHLNTRKPDYAYINDYAYPLNTIGKPEIMDKLLKWSAEHNVYGLGRWGEHRHYNSDTTVGLAMAMAEKFISRKDI